MISNEINNLCYLMLKGKQKTYYRDYCYTYYGIHTITLYRTLPRGMNNPNGWTIQSHYMGSSSDQYDYVYSLYHSKY
jgi:hypothetical protein